MSHLHLVRREPRWVPYLSALPPTPRQPPQPVGTPGAPDYLDLGRWWETPTRMPHLRTGIRA